MNDNKNIETLFQEMKEINLPNGYDHRFYEKLEREENPLQSFFKKVSILNVPSGLGWAASFGSILFVAWSILKVKNENVFNDVAISDEIDMLQDLEILEAWNEKENV
jgi:hypothetical protein